MIVLVTGMAYFPALQGGFLWDDNAHVTTPALRSLSGLSRIWFDVHATYQYYPLLHSAFWIQYQLWGDHQLGYHLVNLLLHAAAAGLVYVILRNLEIAGAYVAAAMFALHPVQVESVAWITEQKNTLSAVFYLAAMIMYLRFDAGRKRLPYALALGLFVLALLSKTVTTTLPAALLVIFWWKRGKLSWRQDVLPLVPFFIVGVAAGLFTAWAERTLIGAEGDTYELTALQRGLLAGRAIWFYLSKLVWPTNLIFVYPRWEVNPSIWWQWLFPLAATLVLVVLWLLRRRWRAPLAAWLFFTGTLFPALGFFNVYPFRYSFVADHFQYLASLGIFVPTAAVLALAGAGRPRQVRRLGAALSVVMLGTLAALTWRQSQMYHDIETLWHTTIDRNPTCWMAFNNLGNVLQSRGRFPEAIPLYEQALRIKPDHGPAHNNLGSALLNVGRPEEAIDHLQRALLLMPAGPQIYNNLGFAFYQTGHLAEAIEQYQQALSLSPGGSIRAYANMAIAYAGLHRPGEAIAAAQKGVDLARSQGRTERAESIEGWLNSYRASQSNTAGSSLPELPSSQQ